MTQYLKASSQLLGSYLHQDWVDEFKSDEKAINKMMSSEPSELIIDASKEIIELLKYQMSEADLAIIMVDKIGCYFDPASKGQTYREWLSYVLKQWRTLE